MITSGVLAGVAVCIAEADLYSKATKSCQLIAKSTPGQPKAVVIVIEAYSLCMSGERAYRCIFHAKINIWVCLKKCYAGDRPIMKYTSPRSLISLSSSCLNIYRRCTTSKKAIYHRLALEPSEYIASGVIISNIGFPAPTRTKCLNKRKWNLLSRAHACWGGLGVHFSQTWLVPSSYH